MAGQVAQRVTRKLHNISTKDSVSFVGCLVLLCIRLNKKTIGTLYKHLDSEIKHILFVEITGYNPINNGKYTFKYKAWLILNE